jgi:hypothetical protein
VRHLGALGFGRVHNRNDDFYAADAAGALPAHDVLLTNPPYSADHPERLLQFCGRNGKPWLALQPSWVCAKEYYEDATAAEAPLYIVPHKRYHYWTPRGRRSDVAAGGAKSKTHGHTNAALGTRTSPFVSFWYIGGLSETVRAKLRALPADERFRVCWSLNELPVCARL